MRTTAIVVAVVLAIGAASCVQRISFGPTGRSLPKQEVAYIRIVDDPAGGCKLADKTPMEIRTDAGSAITWQIVGSCADSRVAIEPQFRRNHERHQVVTGLPSDGVPAVDGRKITATVRKDLPPGLRKGHYKFTVLINRKPAEYASPADDGSFFLCPIWPCGDFEAY